MKTVCCILLALLARQAIPAVIRGPPAFSKPVYSSSYLPAAMQVIYHAVDQLKALQAVQTGQSSTPMASPSTSPLAHSAQNEQVTVQYSSTAATSSTIQSPTETKDETLEEKTEVPSREQTEETQGEETSTEKLEESSQNQPEESKVAEASQNNVEETSTGKVDESTEKETSTEKSLEDSLKSKVNEEKIEDSRKEAETSDSLQAAEESIEDPSRHRETPEANEETPETNYAIPETNYESPEVVHAVQETNQEVPEENHEWSSSSSTETRLETATEAGNAADSIGKATIVENDETEKKGPTIDTVIQGVYEILKPTTSKFVDEDVGPLDESKSTAGTSLEKMENVEEENDETRFTQLGEKVTQVPRPSLSSYLRRSKVPPSPTLQQLANLYDSLSKDARKQGFGKYTGYSDEVLNTLETSAEGGIGPQLKKILDKVLQRNELTREDAKAKTSQAIRDLNSPSSSLSKELRQLLPLRYSP